MGSHLNISSRYDRDLFFHRMKARPSFLPQITTLEINLDANKHDAYIDDVLATALEFFHPDPDGTNPHNVHLIKITVQGNIVFTQHDYVLASPVVSYDVEGNLHKMMTNELSKEQKKELAFIINSAEKSVSKALLQIRRVSKIVIEEIGKARMDPAFENLIKGTLVLPVGRDLDTPVSPDTKNTFARNGPLLSEEYANVQHPYPTRTYIVKADPEHRTRRVPLDETALVLGHFLVRSDDEIIRNAIAAFNALPIKQKGQKFNSNQDVNNSLLHKTHRTRGRKVTYAAATDSDPEEIAYSTLEEMVRIMRTHQDGEDLGLTKTGIGGHYIDQKTRGARTKDGQWLVLTGKGAMCYLGWRVL